VRRNPNTIKLEEVHHCHCEFLKNQDELISFTYNVCSFDASLPELEAPPNGMLVTVDDCDGIYRPLPADEGRGWCIRAVSLAENLLCQLLSHLGEMLLIAFALLGVLSNVLPGCRAISRGQQILAPFALLGILSWPARHSHFKPSLVRSPPRKTSKKRKGRSERTKRWDRRLAST